jgi:transposase
MFENMSKRAIIDRVRVIDLARRGKGKQAIMRETGLSAGFVQKWMHRSETEDAARIGRPRKATPKVVSTIRRIMYGRRRRSLRHVVGILKNRKIAEVSHETVRKAARAAGLKPYKRPAKPRMTDAQRAARVRFATTHAKYDWTSVFFSDETTIVTHGKPNRQIDRIWVQSADEVPPVETQKYSSFVKFWGGIGYYGKSALVVCEKPFNSKEYIRVLKAGLAGVDSQYDGPWELQQDGDPAHTSAETLAWLARRNPPVSVLEGWPSGSPDASVIENAWPVLKDNIAAREPRSKKDLIRIAKDEWRKLDLDFCRTLIDSMPRRLLLIRRAKGGPIPY